MKKIKDLFHLLEGIISSMFYRNPSEKIKLIGITGTSGKTTIATVLYQLFRELGYKTGLISSIVNKINDKELHTDLTMDRISTVNKLLKKMVDEGCEYCFIEVTSQAIDQNRHSGLQFAGIVFTNLSQDHLDYHHTMDEYAQAKKKLFDYIGSKSFALVNIDDKYGPFMLKTTKARKASFGMDDKADYKVKLIDNTSEGIKIDIGGRIFQTKFLGKHNAYNLAAVYAVAKESGISKDDILNEFDNLKPVRGRTQVIKSDDGIVGIVDYAHKPEALKKVLESLNETKTQGQRIISIVGCGGDRDKGKRPKMAKIGYDLSDQLIITSDNPRTEDPRKIIKDMQSGIQKEKNYDQVLTIEDRKSAIEEAVKIAKKRDIVLVAGKGHEDYQIIGTKKHHFDDVEELRKAYEKFRK